MRSTNYYAASLRGEHLASKVDKVVTNE